MSKRNKLITICAASMFCAPAIAQVKPAQNPMKSVTALPSAMATTQTPMAQEPAVGASAAAGSARTTLEQMAAYARQAQQAATLAKLAPAPKASEATAFTPPTGPFSYPPAPHAGGAGGALPRQTDDVPRLVSIMGTPGHEQAQIALGGYIYTVSMLSPSIGDSHWALIRIDVPARAVELRKAPSKKGEKAKTVLLGFAVRDPDEPVAIGNSGIPGAMAMTPPALFAGGMH